MLCSRSPFTQQFQFHNIAFANSPPPDSESVECRRVRGTTNSLRVRGTTPDLIRLDQPAPPAERSARPPAAPLSRPSLCGSHAAASHPLQAACIARPPAASRLPNPPSPPPPPQLPFSRGKVRPLLAGQQGKLRRRRPLRPLAGKLRTREKGG